MSYTKDVYNSAKAELNRRKLQAEALSESNHKKILQNAPQLALIEREIANAGVAVSRAIINGGDVKASIEKIAKNNLELQQHRKNIIVSLGYDENYLDVKYSCKICSDEGFVNGKICECHKLLLQEIACRFLNQSSPLAISTFESFKLEYYPLTIEQETGICPRQKMEEIFRYCQTYSADFSKFSPSLFLYGSTGLGKTHLSLAIAGRAINQGFGVVYDSAQNLLNKMQTEYFGRNNEEKNNTQQLVLDCDLLIIDDLGAEFSSPFTVSAIYNILNSRILTGKPVIISTNLSLRELEDKYSQRITSRIIGNYVSLRFFGRDIRQLKRTNS